MSKFYFLLLGLGLFTSVNAQVINFPDANFKKELINGGIVVLDLNEIQIIVDSNGNGEIEVSEALNVSYLFFTGKEIVSLEGISNFKNLTKLYCNSNQLNTLDVTGLKKLKWLNCANNNLTSLNCTNLSNLTLLECNNNLLTSIDLKGLNFMPAINFSNNLFLTSIFMKDINMANPNFNWSNLSSGFNISNCPNLNYICANEIFTSNIIDIVNKNGYAKCEVNSYCSFKPGEIYYTIQGITKLDSNLNGCESNDISYPNLKFSITDGTNTYKLFSNLSGKHFIPLLKESCNITPIIENPSYFNISPDAVNANFKKIGEIYNQDFCITPNGIHQDVEVALLPLDVARPGFDSNYKIIYKNIGTKTLSGSVKLNILDEKLLDFVSANPTTSNQTTNNLYWEYSDLKPFETREINFTVNINSPMETPSVNAGDILSFVATVFPIDDDLSPENNGSPLRQTVVNSFDPNDKTCLEGDKITLEMIGREVHYMIRFENTGTFAAQNIVVKDMIDTAKFDVNSLVPLRGSHEFVTKISDGNKVEFIFENILLPFDDANNDGYISFKIKTKPTLTVGDSFSNTASIYFDYNAPIVTNTATTTIAVLGKQDFEFSNYFSLYPNPATTNLHLSLKNEIEVSSINIYNTLGQVVLIIPNAKQVKTVDVSGLSRGNYFIKLNTDKGNTVEQFIKK